MMKQKFRSQISAVSLCTYRTWVPDQIGEFPLSLDHQVENQDHQDDKRTGEPPWHLPEDAGLVSDHELHVLIEPATRQDVDYKQSMVQSEVNCVFILPGLSVIQRIEVHFFS